MVADVLIAALRHLWVTLETSGTTTALMGGLALASWKHVRATRDIDLLIGLEGRTVDDLLAELQRAEIRPKHTPPVKNLGKLRIIQCIYEPPEAFMDLQLDLLVAECDYQRQALSRRLPERLSGLDIPIFVLTCEDLIVHKLLAGRMIDRADCVSLIRLQRENIDWPYLRSWAARLSLTQALSEACDEAFPGESL